MTSIITPTRLFDFDPAEQISRKLRIFSSIWICSNKSWFLEKERYLRRDTKNDLFLDIQKCSHILVRSNTTLVCSLRPCGSLIRWERTLGSESTWATWSRSISKWTLVRKWFDSESNHVQEVNRTQGALPSLNQSQFDSFGILFVKFVDVRMHMNLKQH